MTSKPIPEGLRYYFDRRSSWLRGRKIFRGSQVITVETAWAQLAPNNAQANVVKNLYSQWVDADGPCIDEVQAVISEKENARVPSVLMLRTAIAAIEASLPTYDALRSYYISVGFDAFDAFHADFKLRLTKLRTQYLGELEAAAADDEGSVSEIDTPTKVVKNKKKKVPNHAFKTDPKSRVGGPVRPGIADVSSLKIGAPKVAVPKKSAKATTKEDLAELTRKAKPNVGVGWERTWCASLGEGSYGAAVAWLDTDGNGRIRDRVVVKVAASSEKEWNRPTAWYEATSNEDQAWHGHHMEAAALRIAHARSLAWETSDNPIGESIIKCRGYRADKATYTYRMYMEYCGFGDLDNLLKRHMAVGRTNGFMQEPVIWRMLEGLTEACVLLSGSSKPGYLGGKDVVHRDLKPANIALGAPQEHKWRGWPTPKMIDFGMAFVASKDTKGNPTDFQGAGTYGFFTPEQNYTNDELKEPPQRMSARTNIFAIGLTIMRLMELTTKPEWTVDYLDEEVWPPPDLGISFSILGPKLVYSEDLINTVKGCVAFEATNRWDPRALLAHVQKRTGNDKPSKETKFMRETTDLTHSSWSDLMIRSDPLTLNPLYSNRASLDDVLDLDSEEEGLDDKMLDLEDFDGGGVEIGEDEEPFEGAFSFDKGDDAAMMDRDGDAIMEDETAEPRTGS